jgi:hypothetical protein
MNDGIATGGRLRLLRGQKKLTLESLEKKYAKKIAASGPLQRQQIYERMAEEWLKQKNHKPSAATLW